MTKLRLLFVFVLMSNAGAMLLQLDITSTVQFTKKFTDLSVCKKNVEVLKYLILNISKAETNLAFHYTRNIEEKTQEVFKQINLVQPSNDAIIDGDQDVDNLIVSIADYFAIVQNFFNTFIDKLKRSTDDSELCALPWADGMLRGTNLIDALKSIKLVTSEVNFITVFNNVINTLNVNRCWTSRTTYCDQNVTMPDKLISVYHLMAAVDRKYFTMKSFVKLIQSSCKNETNTHNLFIERELLTMKTQKYLEILKRAMSHVERGLYRCSRKGIPKSDQQYIELEGFKRTVVLNERVHSSENSCFLSCLNINEENASISYADHEARREYCPGRLTDCQSGGGSVEMCHAVPGSSRLYEWIKTNVTDEVFGNFSDCSDSVEIMKSYEYENYTNFQCEPCICTCNQDTSFSPSQFGVSLREEISDFENNEVITGMKFEKKGQIIYPQIEVGKVLADGQIEEVSVRWKPLNSIDLMDNTLNVVPENNQQEYVNFGSLSKDAQYFSLVQTYLTDEFVATGFKFILVQEPSLYANTNENFISFAIQATHYNMKTGKLGKYPSGWITFDSLKNEDQCRTYRHRRELKFPDSDNPLKYDTFDINSINGDYVRFWPSSLKKDAGQTTVPLLDAAPVSGTRKFPISGVGLYHKGPMNGAGFISFEIAGIDHSQIINTLIPPEDRIDLDSVLSTRYK